MTHRILIKGVPVHPKHREKAMRHVCQFGGWRGHYPNHPYSVNYLGYKFVSHDTAELVDQLALWMEQNPDLVE